MNNCKMKTKNSDKIKGRVLNNEVFGVKYVFERENVLHINKDGRDNMVIYGII